MSYSAKILADSVSDAGVRLTTIQVTFPRFILAEVNTHRVFSRNSASSRAIPPEKLIDKVRKSPFVPETFNSRVKGMGVGEKLDAEALDKARYYWHTSRDYAIKAARGLLELDVDKSRINRLLEPFMWHTAIISSTEWDNFYALRCPPGDEATIEFPAQLEFQKTAIEMRKAMRASEPILVRQGEWHMPLVDEIPAGGLGVDDMPEPPDFWQMVSAGRCARVSYDTHENFEHPGNSFERARKLKDSGHLSPFEHVATPRLDAGFWTAAGNFCGWTQYRSLIPGQANFGGSRWDAPGT